MGARTGGSSDRGTASRTATTWVVSRHLLVAQAVSAALTSVGRHVHAIPWGAVGWDLDLPDAPAALSSDVVVVLDDVDDPTAIDEIRALVGAAGARVLVATSHPQDLYWGGLIEGAGVEEVGLATSVRQLADLIEQFEAGESLLNTHVRAVLAQQWVEELEKRRRIAMLMGTLSPKEGVVLELLAAGRRVREIGRLLEVSDSTIRSHVKALRGKLGAETQLAAVAMFIQFKNSGMHITFVPRPRRG